MRCFKYLLFFFLMMLPNVVFAAIGNICSSDDYFKGVVSPDDCTHLRITGDDDLSLISSGKYTFDGVMVDDGTFTDLSFLSNFDAPEVEFNKAKVDFDKFDMQVKSVEISFSHIIGDDLSGLKNDLILEELRLSNNWMKNISSVKSLKNLSSFKKFSFIENRVLIVDLNPIMELPNLNFVSLNGAEHNVTPELLNHLNSKGVDTSEYSDGPSIMERAKNAFNQLNLFGLSDEEQIRRISIWIVEHITYQNADGPSIGVALDGKGVCANYSALTSLFMEMAGFEVYDVGGYVDPADPANSSHAWNIVYFNNQWLAIDNTWLDTPTALEKLKNGQSVEYFMVPIDGTFKNDHIMTDVLDNYIDYSYDLTYYSDGNIYKIEKVPLNKSSYTLVVPTKSGYTFEAWYLDSSFSKKLNSVNDINKNTSLYAKWTANTVTPGEEGSGTVPNPKTGFFVSLFIVDFFLSPGQVNISGAAG